MQTDEPTLSKYAVNSPKFWLAILAALIVVLAVTALKDWLLSEQAPDPAFYAFVPVVFMASQALAIWVAARLTRQPAAFPVILAIVLGSSILMQITEILFKLVYYYVWAYPGLLYLLVTIPLGIAIVGYGLHTWAGAPWRRAIFLALVGDLAASIVTALVMSATGLATTGS